MVVTVYYDNGTSEVITRYAIDKTGPLTAADTLVTITYQGKTTTVKITVSSSVPIRIEITTPPEKISYFIGQTFNKAGMVITAYYDNNTSRVVTDYTYSPNGALSLTDTKIIISYGGKQLNR
jgi:hypothetical protein